MTTSVSFEAHHSALPVQIFSNDSEGLISRFTGLASEDGQGVTVNSRGNLTPTIQDAVLLQEINNDTALGRSFRDAGITSNLHTNNHLGFNDFSQDRINVILMNANGADIDTQREAGREIFRVMLFNQDASDGLIPNGNGQPILLNDGSSAADYETAYQSYIENGMASDARVNNFINEFNFDSVNVSDVRAETSRRLVEAQFNENLITAQQRDQRLDVIDTSLADGRYSVVTSQSIGSTHDAIRTHELDALNRAAGRDIDLATTAQTAQYLSAGDLRTLNAQRNGQGPTETELSRIDELVRQATDLTDPQQRSRALAELDNLMLNSRSIDAKTSGSAGSLAGTDDNDRSSGGDDGTGTGGTSQDPDGSGGGNADGSAPQGFLTQFFNLARGPVVGVVGSLAFATAAQAAEAAAQRENRDVTGQDFLDAAAALGAPATEDDIQAFLTDAGQEAAIYQCSLHDCEGGC